MIITGVTGGIGSGKTTVCKEWEKLGATVVYADDLAKTLMVKDKALKASLIDSFGKNTYNSDGSLNRGYLIQEAFQKGRVEELNQLVHPAVAKTFSVLAEEAKKSGAEMMVEEAALLLNNGRPTIFDVIVIVRSARETRLERVSRRDSVPKDVVSDRDQKQPDFEAMLHLSDYTINNEGTLEDLKEKSRRLYHQILSDYSKGD